MLTVDEIEIIKIRDEWLDYWNVKDDGTGSIAVSNFPKKAEVGERYYLIQDVQFIKGIALKLR